MSSPILFIVTTGPQLDLGHAHRCQVATTTPLVIDVLISGQIEPVVSTDLDKDIKPVQLA